MNIFTDNFFESKVYSYVSIPFKVSCALISAQMILKSMTRTEDKPSTSLAYKKIQPYLFPIGIYFACYSTDCFNFVPGTSMLAATIFQVASFSTYILESGFFKHKYDLGLNCANISVFTSMFSGTTVIVIPLSLSSLMILGEIKVVDKTVKAVPQEWWTAGRRNISLIKQAGCAASIATMNAIKFAWRHAGAAFAMMSRHRGINLR
jgi:hypothetical protein